MINRDLPTTGHFSFARPARPGDFCILLGPVHDTALDRLRQHQEDLRMFLGGRATDPIHLTCNRFVAESAAEIDRVVAALKTRLADLQSFPMIGLSYFPQFSPLRHINILKWRVQPDENLRLIHLDIELALKDARLTSQYPPGWVSSLVTALEDIQPAEVAGGYPAGNNIVSIPTPSPLFNVGEVLITYIQSRTEFRKIAHVPLNPRQAAVS